MKRRSLSLLMVCAAFLQVLLVACPTPGGWGKHGSLTVSINNAINSRTLAPPVSMDVARYTIEGTGPHKAVFSASSTGDPVTVDGLVPGIWTVTVNALNADTMVIGQGVGTAGVAMGETASLAIAVAPLSGTGSLTLSVSWTAPLQNPSIQASLTPISGPEMGVDFGTISGRTATYANPSIPAGYYTLVLQLLEDNVAVAGAVEVVRIVAGQTTSGSYSFVVVMGKLAVSITPSLANPLHVGISGVPATVAAGTNISAIASASDGAEIVDYGWFLNGVLLGKGSSWNLGNNLRSGHYRLDVTAFTPDKARAGSATAEFEVTSGTPSLVGYWNWFRAWARYTGVMEFKSGGTWISWEDYAATMESDGGRGSWSLSGSTLTIAFEDGRSASMALTWVNADTVQFSLPDGSPANLYRKGTEPDGYLFTNQKYSPMPLTSGTLAGGGLPEDGLALYHYVAGVNAQQTTLSWSSNVQVWVYVNEETTADPSNPRWSGTSSEHPVSLAQGQTCSIVVSHRTGLSGDYSILVTDGPVYLGTWVNPAYNGGHGLPNTAPGKFVMTAGSWAVYDSDSDTAWMSVASFVVKDSFFIGNDHYFRGDLVQGDAQMKITLFVSNANGTLTMTGSTTDYPAAPIENGVLVYSRK